MHRPRRIFREPDRVEPLSARSREPGTGGSRLAA